MNRSDYFRRCRVRLLTLLVAFASSSVVHADGDWSDVRQLGRWKFHANFSLDRHERLLNEVANLQIEIPHKLGIQRKEAQVEFYLLRRKNEYRKYVKQHFPSIPYRPALFIKQNGVAMVFAHLGKHFATDLRHEATHATLHSSLPMVPLWIDEGLAEYFEVPKTERLRGNPYHTQLAKQLRPGSILSIRQLESIDDFSKMKSIEYRDSWAWTHYFLHGPEPVRNSLTRYLQTLQQHDLPTPLSKTVAATSTDAEHSLLRHLAATSPRPTNGLGRLSFGKRLLAR